MFILSLGIRYIFFTERNNSIHIIPFPFQTSYLITFKSKIMGLIKPRLVPNRNAPFNANKHKPCPVEVPFLPSMENWDCWQVWGFTFYLKCVGLVCMNVRIHKWVQDIQSEHSVYSLIFENMKAAMWLAAMVNQRGLLCIDDWYTLSSQFFCHGLFLSSIL